MMADKTHTAAGRTVAIAAAAALAVTPTLAAAQTAVGVNAAIRNSVQIQRAGTNQPRPAVLRQRVSLNDEVRTGRASQLQILLLDRSTFTVGANARLRIDRFVYDPNRNSRSVGATVTRGAFRFMSGRALRRPAGPVAVRTPVASIGVRGTILEGVVGSDAMLIAAAEPAVGAQAGGDSETATLIVLRGPGPATQGDTRPGAIDIQAGDRSFLLDRPSLALYVPGGGRPPVGPFVISQAGLQAFQGLLRTIPAFAAASGVGQVGGSPADPVDTIPEPGAQGDPGSGASGQPGPAGPVRGVRGESRLQRLLLPLGFAAAALGAILAFGSDSDRRPVSP